jgi:outer membrane protein assembly factor BamD
MVRTMRKPAAVATAPADPGYRIGIARTLAVIALAASLGACSSLDFFAKKDDTAPDAPADKLYNEGLYLLNAKKDPKQAVKKFEEVDRQHPYSEWARKSLIMTSYAYYQAGEYDDCVNAAKRYITLHPGGADAAYAQYLIGSSYFDEIPDITRDQARTDKALAALDEVIRKYPGSEYAVSARRKMAVARDQLAGKEMEVGRYYLKKKDYTGAINRFKVVVTKFQTWRSA